jgi:hypothetical protein
MSSIGSESSSAFHELSRERCKELLATHRAGRVAWHAADGPMVYQSPTRCTPVT